MKNFLKWLKNVLVIAFAAIVSFFTLAITLRKKKKSEIDKKIKSKQSERENIVESGKEAEEKKATSKKKISELKKEIKEVDEKEVDEDDPVDFLRDFINE